MLGSAPPQPTQPVESRRLTISSQDARRDAAKELAAEWKSLNACMGWVVLREPTALNTPTKTEWQALLPYVQVSHQVASSLNTWSHFRVTE